jgi:hypothetical protein
MKMKHNWLFLVFLFCIYGCTTPLSTETLIASQTITPFLITEASEISTNVSLTATIMPTIESLIPTKIVMPNTPTPTPEVAYSYRPTLLDGNYLLFKTARDFLDIKVVHDSSFKPFLSILSAKVEYGTDTDLSPDGTLFAYVLQVPTGMFKKEVPRIMILDLIGNNLKKVAGGEGCFNPSFAPDSRSLAMICLPDFYSVSPSTIYYIVLVDLINGTNTKVFHTNEGYISSLAWSPDGKTIGFYQYKDGSQKDSYDPLYLLNSSCFKDPQTCQTQYHYLISTKHIFRPVPIEWSPDSQRILVMYDFNDLRIINVVDGLSKNIAKLEDGQSFSEYVWSPDNLSVGFTESWFLNKDNKNKIWIEPVQGGDRKSISVESEINEDDGAVLVDWIKLMDFKVGRSYTVTPLVKELILREKPTINGKMIKSLKAYDTVVLVDGPVNADYCSWWKMKVGDVEGWAQGIKYWFDAVK